MNITDKIKQFTQQHKNYCLICDNDLSITLCTFCEGKVLSQARSKNFHFILTFLPSFFCDIFNIYSKEILQRDQIWTMMTKACLDGARSNTGGFFSLNWKEGSLLSLSVLSLRSVKHRQIGFLMGGKSTSKSIFILWGCKSLYFQAQLNISKWKLTSHFIWSSSCQSIILLILPPPPLYSWTWCGLWQLFGLSKLKSTTAWQSCFCLTSACTG